MDEQLPKQAGSERLPRPADFEPRLAERWTALVDMLYITQVTWLYVFSAIYPVMGLFYGILLLAGSVSPRGKRIGRVCLILGIINTAIVLIGGVVVLVLALSGVLAGLAAGE